MSQAIAGMVLLITSLVIFYILTESGGPPSGDPPGDGGVGGLQ